MLCDAKGEPNAVSKELYFLTKLCGGEAAFELDKSNRSSLWLHPFKEVAVVGHELPEKLHVLLDDLNVALEDDVAGAQGHDGLDLTGPEQKRLEHLVTMLV